MAVINTLVAKSQDVKDAALNINAQAFAARRTLAALWDLKPTTAAPPPPEAAFSLDMRNESGESVVGEGDERVKVDDVHFAPGGKYRSIVKLFIHYEFQKPGGWAMGTGWLISPDIFVTAGHCSYDWGHKMGRAEEVKAYIGYKGHQSEKDPSVQFRRVKRIVTTEGWVKTKGSKCFDVSFMQLDKPFEGVQPIKFEETPAKGNMTIGVVGYPGDLSDKQTGERGAYMYEMFLPTEFDLATQSDTMLEYQIDTFGGNSGSPVLRQHDLVSIGAHVYGGTFNSASVIGKFGNPYVDYLAAFGLPLTNNGLNLIPVTGNSAISAPVPSAFAGGLPSAMNVTGPVVCDVCKTRKVDLPSSQPSKMTPAPPPAQGRNQVFRQPSSSQPRSSTRALQQHRSGTGGNRQMPLGKAGLTESADEEGFFDILRKAASVGAPLLGTALKTALPIALGPIGGPVGALAGFALNAAGRAAAETTGAESTMAGEDPHEGAMERAILAEATLSAIQNMELSHEAEESIFSDMKDAVMKTLPTIRKAAPHVMGAMMEPALRIALDSLHNYNQKGAAGAENFESGLDEPFRAPVYSHAIDQPADRQTEAFLRNLHGAMQQHTQESTLDAESEEGFFDIIKIGARFAGKGVLAVAKQGLPILVNALQESGSAESVEAESGDASSQAFSADALAHRAVVAEAALQAVMKLPPQQLQEEGFFDFIASAVKTIAPVALKMAPAVAKAINPTVGKIVSGVLGQESTMVGESAPGARRRLQDAPALKSRRSLATLRSQGAGYGTQHVPASAKSGSGQNGYAPYDQRNAY